MNNDQIKALATQVAIVRQALTVAAAVSEDLRVALQPSLNQVAILFTDAVLAATAHAEEQSVAHAEALQVALATLGPLQTTVLSALAQAGKPNE